MLAIPVSRCEDAVMFAGLNEQLILKSQIKPDSKYWNYAYTVDTIKKRIEVLPTIHLEVATASGTYFDRVLLNLMMKQLLGSKVTPVLPVGTKRIHLWKNGNCIFTALRIRTAEDFTTMVNKTSTDLRRLLA
jgi:hypothetical protein